MDGMSEIDELTIRWAEPPPPRNLLKDTTVGSILLEIRELRAEVERLTGRVSELESDVNRLIREK